MRPHVRTLVGLSAVVIFISVSMAFSTWFRMTATLVFMIPLELMVAYIVPHRLRNWWKDSLANHNNLQKLRTALLKKASIRRQDRSGRNPQRADTTAIEIRPTNSSLQSSGVDVHESRLRRIWYGGAGAMSSSDDNPV